ncbi:MULTISPECIES: 2-hydroxyacid dehydrogenase [Yersinia pseudotuberculosis complex]|uniref:D-isomer specific 2-hydroxyacid dehydrogenase family protein n=1 Tax=Yersinia pseudotuberculosis serotype O:1b (strain IP 31758) TaxID=349747 RepID=A0A0U1R2H6_YERP3|nr:MULTISPECIES: 2-hydroxyacid dehydrogenase [Yersinia pseudotuberculosis complex]ABS49474.1 D-isomer specific 2-hydroxyacid dehydrogenase family protein [Yersinia pseudotuberculosis IP 31758]AJK18201.1 D-isomer specific 2-hydroxyacid dehydrogenase, NAD binding domain protein [Yersinia pseudotuberculosis str. PA3606]MCE4111158.1 2-hydroxyacid dehydrogenase [Yersinia pseudotuberculosis]MCF1162611.1 2-hydroxyacid dehydrogenase [Yersinia pseudotuberculosis]RYC25611.1 2-hydroxyacid dehydrogenase [
MKNSKQAVLIIAPVMDYLTEKLEQTFTVHKLYQVTDQAEFLAEQGNNIKGIVTRGDIGVTNEVLALLPEVQIISIFGVGTDAVDLDYTRERNIIVTTTPGVLTDDVADTALGLIIATSRRFYQASQFLRAGEWPNGSLPLSSKVTGKRLGIFGMGRIGRAIARRAVGFDMQIAYIDTVHDSSLPYQYVPDLISLAKQSDILVVAISGGKDSAGLVDKAIFAAMPNHGILINIARGSMVNQDDLISALQQQQIGGAGLDVFADEPHVPQALIEMDNVFLLPHIASATTDTRIQMSDIVFSNILAHFSGETAPTAITY